MDGENFISKGANIVLQICKIIKPHIEYCRIFGGAHGVMVIVAGNGHGDTSSSPGQDWLHFT